MIFREFNAHNQKNDHSFIYFGWTCHRNLGRITWNWWRYHYCSSNVLYSSPISFRTSHASLRCNSACNNFATSTGSTFSHHKKKTILPSVLKIIVPGLVSGSILGGVLSSYISDRTLQIFFGTISILFAVYFYFPKLPQLNIAREPNKSLFVFGILVGCLSSLLGVGGGIFLIPILLGYHVSLQNTVASSSAGTLATAFVGTVIYPFLSEGKVTVPDTIGYIHVPAFLAMGISSLLTTSFGCKLSHTLPPIVTKRVFSAVLCITGFSMVFLK